MKKKSNDIKNMKNITGSNFYTKNTQKVLMGKIAEGIAKVEEKEREEAEKERKIRENSELLKEFMGDMKEFEEYQRLKKKFDENGISAVPEEVLTEGNSVEETVA